MCVLPGDGCSNSVAPSVGEFSGALRFFSVGGHGG